jgi:hypothetical protein
MINLMTVIQSLRPKAEVTIRDGVEIEWLDSVQTQPTDAEIATEDARLQAEYDAQAYARSRKAEYPTIQECVHAILDDDLDALQVLRQAVKDKYPKE